MWIPFREEWYRVRTSDLNDGLISETFVGEAREDTASTTVTRLRSRRAKLRLLQTAHCSTFNPGRAEWNEEINATGFRTSLLVLPVGPEAVEDSESLVFFLLEAKPVFATTTSRAWRGCIHRILNTDVAVVREFPIDTLSKGGGVGILDEDPEEFPGRFIEILSGILLYVDGED